MIRGIGIDICDVKKLKSAVKRSKKFLNRVFSAGEISYCRAKKEPFLHFAGRFAVKESFIKAVSVDKSIRLNEIETKNNKSGKPDIVLKGKVKAVLKKKKIKKVMISISHTKAAAAAVCVLE